MEKQKENEQTRDIRKQTVEEMIKRNREESEKNRKIIEAVMETQRKAALTQNSIKSTLEGVKETLGNIQTTTEKIDKFKQDYEDVLQRLAKNIEKEESHLEIRPEVLPVKQIVENVMKYDRFVIVTGAGLSAASGIPTFRGTGGYWTNIIEGDNQEVYEAKQMLTSRFYEKYPDIVWKWHKQFAELSEKCKPNQGHILLDKICQYLINNGKQVIFITQNLDNLQPQNPKFKINHIHGDIKYIRCQGKQMHLAPFSLEQTHCKQCPNKMRPHTLFFDQVYQHHYGGSVMNIQYDVIFSIGTMLQTNFARRLVRNAKQFVEINPEPVVHHGKGYTLATKAQVALKQIYNELTSK